MGGPDQKTCRSTAAYHVSMEADLFRLLVALRILQALARGKTRRLTVHDASGGSIRAIRTDSSDKGSGQ